MTWINLAQGEVKARGLYIWKRRNWVYLSQKAIDRFKGDVEPRLKVITLS